MAQNNRENNAASAGRLSGLISTAELADKLADPTAAQALRIYDCTCYLIADPEKVYTVKSGFEDWQSGHIPGAGFLDLPGQLSDRSQRLRFMMPPAAQFEQAMSEAGLGNDNLAVLYARGNVHWATRIWWMLRAFGFDNALILEGNFERWADEGRPVSQAAATYPKATFKATPRPELIADKHQVLAAIGQPDSVIINALSPAQHAGEGVHYGRPGRIKGSVNVPARNLSERASGNYLDNAGLAALFDTVGAAPEKQIVAYCGGGIAASNTAFVLAQLGFPNISLYDASLSEWVQDPDLPMETG